MAKIILSPLFLALMVVWVLQGWKLRKRWKAGWSARLAPFCSLFVLTLLTLASMPVVSNILANTLKVDSFTKSDAPFDAVVVLGGGYVLGPTPDKDRLAGESVLRVIQAVEVYYKFDAKWLVVSGSPMRNGELMRDMAMLLGVPTEKIIMETQSKNTWEHPRYLKTMCRFHADSRLAVVTSSWHLPRALREFRRFFPQTMPAQSYYFSSRFQHGWQAWMPQVDALESTTTILHEYLGMIWYGFKNFMRIG